VRAVLRRTRGDLDTPQVIRAGELEIDLGGRRVARDGEWLDLSRTEFNLLAVLAQHPGQAFSRAQLLQRLHGVAFDGYERSTDAHINKLRRKIALDPATPRYVETVYGVGYRFAAG